MFIACVILFILLEIICKIQDKKDMEENIRKNKEEVKDYKEKMLKKVNDEWNARFESERKLREEKIKSQ